MLADQDVTLHDHVNWDCASLFCLPVFTKGKDQLSRIEVEETRAVVIVK